MAILALNFVIPCGAEEVKIYKGTIFDNGVKVREVTLYVEGCKIKVIFGKATYQNMSKPEEFTYNDEAINSEKFLLNPSGAVGGGYAFSRIEGGGYLVKVELSSRSTGKSGKSFCEGTLFPK